MTTRRNFIKAAGVAGVGTVASAIASPAVAKSKIRWRLQTYAGPALGAHVIKRL